MICMKVKGHGLRGGEEQLRELNKRMKVTENSNSKDAELSEIFCPQENMSKILKIKRKLESGETAPESEGMVSDVAAAIEDLLAQSRKVCSF